MTAHTAPRPALAAESASPHAARETAITAPPPGLMGVKDIAENPGWGVLSGSRAAGYEGGTVCPRPTCLTAIKLRGRYIPEEQALAGAFIELSSRAAGLKCEGEIRGKTARFTCPRCGKYQQLAIEVTSREPEFRAVFVRRAEGGA